MSRRSRFKGIANIPQRRKPTVVEAKDEVAESNLAQAKSELQSEAVSSTEVKGNATKPTTEAEQPVVDKGTVNDAPNEPAAKPVLGRRRFKPAVSLKTISRGASTSTAPSSSITKDPQTPPVQEEPAAPESASVATIETPPTPVLRESYVKISDVGFNTEISSHGITKLQFVPNSEPASVQDNQDEPARPPPPVSPSKLLNRARIKAVPHLGQRRVSVNLGSASESEDESKKASLKTYRNRNDSVCSTASIAALHDSTPDTSRRRQPEFSTMLQRKARRTEHSRKLAEARRDFNAKFNNGKPDRQKLTMLDLLFYNPAGSPMTQKRKHLDTETSTTSTTVQQEEEHVDEPPPPESDEENTLPAPQITIGPNGEIVVDEKSLYVENKEVKRSREALKKSALVDGDQDIEYGVYKRPKRSKDWSKEDTLRFYKALHRMGTDFALMCELFPERTRRELMMKFKKEERMNQALIDRAVMQPIQFDISELQRDLQKQEMVRLHQEELKKAKEERKAAKEAAKAEGNNPPKRRRVIPLLTADPGEGTDQKQTLISEKLDQGIKSLLSADESRNIKRKKVAVDKSKGSENTEENNTNAEVNGEQANHFNINDELIDTNIENENRTEGAEDDKTEVETEDYTVEITEDLKMEEVKNDTSELEQNQSEETRINHCKDIVVVEEIAAKTAEASLENPQDINYDALERKVAELHGESVDDDNDEAPHEQEDTEDAEDLVEGSLILSSSINDNGDEVYSAFTVNERKEKVPMDLTPEILQALLADDDSADTEQLTCIEDPLALSENTSVQNELTNIALSDQIIGMDCIMLSLEGNIREPQSGG